MKTRVPKLLVLLIWLALAKLNATWSIAQAFSNADWVSLGSLAGANGSVNCMVMDKHSGIFYVGGFFTGIGSVAASGVVAWNGTSWSPVGSVISNVRALAADGLGNIYAAGAFTNTAISATNIAKWNGSTWSAVGTGMNGLPSAVAADGSGNVYIGGFFTNTAISATNIAKWNGSSWSNMGGGMNANVNALALDSSGNLYAGGAFSTVNGFPTPFIAEWTGSSWSGLSSGMSSGVGALVIDSAQYPLCRRRLQNGGWHYRQ